MFNEVPTHNAFKILNATKAKANGGSTQGNKAYEDHGRKVKELESKLALAGGSSTPTGAPIFSTLQRLHQQWAMRHFQ
jgi:hypothetical protein